MFLLQQISNIYFVNIHIYVIFVSSLSRLNWSMKMECNHFIMYLQIFLANCHLNRAKKDWNLHWNYSISFAIHFSIGRCAPQLARMLNGSVIYFRVKYRVNSFLSRNKVQFLMLNPFPPLRKIKYSLYMCE